MKNISLYVEQDTYLTRLHPFAKLTYILAAVSVPLIDVYKRQMPDREGA